MDDAKEYSIQDIEMLKQKIATYREGLTTLKMANSVVDFQLMEKKQDMKREEYEKQIKKHSEQLESFNQTVEELNKELSLILNELKNEDVNNEVDNIQVPVDFQSSSNAANQFEPIENDFTENISLTQDQASVSSIQQSNLPPSYKQLQSLAGRVISPQGIPNNTAPTTTSNLEEIHPQNLFFNKQSTAPTGIPPNQLYNGLYRNISMRATIQSEYNARKKVIPLNVNEIANSSFSSPADTTEENEVVMEVFDDVHEIALIDENEKEIISITNEIAPPDLNKEGFSFLNIFRKKQ